MSQTIRLRKETVEQLKELGKKGDTYEDIIAWLLENRKRRKRG